MDQFTLVIFGAAMFRDSLDVSAIATDVLASCGARYQQPWYWLRPPGETFLTFLNLFFWKQKPFFHSFCEKPFLALFSLRSLKLRQNTLLRAYICQKFLRGVPPDPHLWKGKPCRTYRIGAHRGTAHRFMPSCLTQKFSVKKKCLKIQISGSNLGSM